MPLSIPAFDQYQQPMFPLRGLWNHAPPEGDKFVNATIDWLVTTKSNAVQFSLSGNSPVSLSQIAALGVDNSRSGADCSFIFPDSGWELVVPARNQLIAPVFTNALMFYASARSAIAGDTVVFQIFNSVPPPVPIAPSVAQNSASVSPIPLNVPSTTQLLPLGTNGTLNTLNIDVQSTVGGVANFFLNDGTGRNIWQTAIEFPATGGTQSFAVPGLSTRFVNGLTLQIGTTSITSGWVVVNLYYSTP
jgi:hypothetical protein